MKKEFKDYPNYYLIDRQLYRKEFTRNGKTYKEMELRTTYRGNCAGYYLDGKFKSLTYLLNY